MNARRRSHTFVVTFLQASPQTNSIEAPADTSLRGRVRHVASSEEIAFTTAAQLLTFFRRYVQFEFATDAPEDQQQT